MKLGRDGLRGVKSITIDASHSCAECFGVCDKGSCYVTPLRGLFKLM